MATFTPGHLHIERHALTKDDVSYDLNIEYEVAPDPNSRDKGMQFKMHGSIQGKDMSETFFLPKVEAYNFASNVTKIAEQYGIPKHLSNIGSIHKHYDMMFEDIRQQLNMKSGDAIDLKEFE